MEMNEKNNIITAAAHIYTNPYVICIYIVYEKASSTYNTSPEASSSDEEQNRRKKSTRYIFSLHAEL